MRLRSFLKSFPTNKHINDLLQSIVAEISQKITITERDKKQKKKARNGTSVNGPKTNVFILRVSGRQCVVACGFTLGPTNGGPMLKPKAKVYTLVGPTFIPSSDPEANGRK